MSGPEENSDIFRLEHGCCPCGANLNAGMDSQRGGARPAPDDYTVCLYCERVLVFGADLRVRELTAEELRDMPPSNRAWLFLALRHVRRAKGARQS